MSSTSTKPPKDLSTLGPNDHVALVGKQGMLIWIGTKTFEHLGKSCTLFCKDELNHPDKIVIVGNEEAWLLRDDLMYKVRLFNIPIAHYPSSHKFHPFQRCIWSGIFNSAHCPEFKRATPAELVTLGRETINQLIRSCEILPSSDDFSEWRELTTAASFPNAGESVNQAIHGNHVKRPAVSSVGHRS